MSAERFCRCLLEQIDLWNDICELRATGMLELEIVYYLSNVKILLPVMSRNN